MNKVDVLISFHPLDLDSKSGLQLFLFSFKFLILFFSMLCKSSLIFSELFGFLFIFFFHVSFIIGKLLGNTSQVGGLFLSNNDVPSSLDL